MPKPLGFTLLVANYIQDAGGNPLTGSLVILATDANDLPLASVAGGQGGAIIAPVTFVFTAGVLPATAWIPTSAATTNPNTSYRFTFQDASGQILKVWPTVQVAGDSFSLDTYQPLLTAKQAVLSPGIQGPMGEVVREQLANAQAMLLDYATAGSTLTPSGSATGAVDSINTLPTAVAPCLIAITGWLESIPVSMHACPAGGTLDIGIYTFVYPNTYTLRDRFTVKPSAAQIAQMPGVVTFLAGVDYTPRIVQAGSYAGWISNGTAQPAYNGTAAAGSYAYLAADPGAIGAATTWTIGQGAVPFACSIRSLLAPAGQQFAGKRAIALGDSLTAGYGSPEYVDTSGNGTQQDTNPAPCYAQIATAILGGVWKGRACTSGISAGRFYASQYPHLASVQTAALTADVCYLFLGTNQVAASLGSIADAPVASDYAGASSFYAQMRGVIETTQAFNPAMQIIGLLPFQNGNNNGPPNIAGGFGGSRDNNIMSAGRARHQRCRFAPRNARNRQRSTASRPSIDLWIVLGLNSFNSALYHEHVGLRALLRRRVPILRQQGCRGDALPELFLHPRLWSRRASRSCRRDGRCWSTWGRRCERFGHGGRNSCRRPPAVHAAEPQ